MEIEEKIRTQIEAILVNDARNYSEIRKMAEDDEPLDVSLPTDERNLYHRIIQGYRNAVNDVNKILEENVASLSGFFRIVDGVKEKTEFQEICTQIVDCLLQDFGADYCGLLFPSGAGTLCVEGIREDRRILRIHSNPSMLGSRELERQVTRMAVEIGDCLHIEDVYKVQEFNAVDFPGVVRSLLCLPLMLHGSPAGFLLLSHSLPGSFQENQIRVLKVLGSYIAHLRLMHSAGRLDLPAERQVPAVAEVPEESDAYAVVLMGFETEDNYGRRMPLHREAVREIRPFLQRVLELKESVLFYGERELFVLMPGVTADRIPERIRLMRGSFRLWQESREDIGASVRMSLGYSVCDGEEDFSRTLEVASLVLHRDADGEA